MSFDAETRDEKRRAGDFVLCINFYFFFFFDFYSSVGVEVSPERLSRFRRICVEKLIVRWLCQCRNKSTERNPIAVLSLSTASDSMRPKRTCKLTKSTSTPKPHPLSNKCMHHVSAYFSIYHYCIVYPCGMNVKWALAIASA